MRQSPSTKVHASPQNPPLVKYQIFLVVKMPAFIELRHDLVPRSLDLKGISIVSMLSTTSHLF